MRRIERTSTFSSRLRRLAEGAAEIGLDFRSAAGLLPSIEAYVNARGRPQLGQGFGVALFVGHDVGFDAATDGGFVVARNVPLRYRQKVAERSTKPPQRANDANAWEISPDKIVRR